MILIRLLALFIEKFDQPSLRAIRVLRPLKLVTGFESKFIIIVQHMWYSTWNLYQIIIKDNKINKSLVILCSN